MHVTSVLQDGYIFDAKVLDLSTDAILAKFKKSCNVQASLSLGAEYPTIVSAPHSLLNGFKNLAAVACASGYSFPQADALLNAAKKATTAGAASSGAAKAGAAAPKEEEKDEEVDTGTGNLFGDDDDGY